MRVPTRLFPFGPFGGGFPALRSCAARGVSLLGIVLLASCVTPTKTEVGADAPARWTADAPEGAVVVNWWETFNDPGLSAAIKEALAGNHDLQAAAARLDAAAAQARMAGAELWPRAGFQFDANRSEQAFVGLPIPGAEDRVLKARATSFGVGLNTFWEVDLWGRVRAGKQAAFAGAEAAQAGFAGAQLSLAAQTAKAWLAVAEARRQVEITRKAAETYETVARQIRLRYERGLRSPLDVRLAAQNTAATQALLSRREELLDRSLRQLELLLGRYPGAQLPGPADLPPLPPAVPAGLPSELLTRRPDLVASEKQLEAADARLWQARASLYPRISLTAGGGTRTSELVDLVSTDFTVWSLAANVAQPLFEGGRLRAGVDVARAGVREAVAGYDGALLRAFLEVESTLAAEQLLEQHERHLRLSVTEAEAALKSAQQRYLTGLETLVTVLETQRRALEAESQLLAVRRQRLDNRIDLHLALGGGFESAP